MKLKMTADKEYIAPNGVSRLPEIKAKQPSEFRPKQRIRQKGD